MSTARSNERQARQVVAQARGPARCAARATSPAGGRVPATSGRPVSSRWWAAKLLGVVVEQRGRHHGADAVVVEGHEQVPGRALHRDESVRGVQAEACPARRRRSRRGRRTRSRRRAAASTATDGLAVIGSSSGLPSSWGTPSRGQFACGTASGGAGSGDASARSRSRPRATLALAVPTGHSSTDDDLGVGQAHDVAEHDRDAMVLGELAQQARPGPRDSALVSAAASGPRPAVGDVGRAERPSPGAGARRGAGGCATGSA